MSRRPTRNPGPRAEGAGKAVGDRAVEGGRGAAFQSWPTGFVVGAERTELEDPVAVEEPLEVLLAVEDSAPEALTVTLRTPGHDHELVAGLLHAEGLLDGRQQLVGLAGPEPSGPLENRVIAHLAPGARWDRGAAERTFQASSACGLCGKTSIAGVFAQGFPDLPAGPQVAPELLTELPQRMRRQQRGFAKTGGLHAAALFDPAGSLRLLREDVGRHNAVDKVVGALLLAGELPPGESLLVVSGRVGFEIVQKALRAGIPLLAAVGAPTSLSLKLAHRGGMTIVGFLRPGRFNVYTGPQRLRSD